MLEARRPAARWFNLLTHPLPFLALLLAAPLAAAPTIQEKAAPPITMDRA